MRLYLAIALSVLIGGAIGFLPFQENSEEIRIVSSEEASEVVGGQVVCSHIRFAVRCNAICGFETISLPQPFGPPEADKAEFMDQACKADLNCLWPLEVGDCDM